MPTRIVLNDNKKRAPTNTRSNILLRPPPASSPAMLLTLHNNPRNNTNNTTTAMAGAEATLLDPVQRRGQQGQRPRTIIERDETSTRSTIIRQQQQQAPYHPASATKHRAILGFRSSLLRELSVRSREESSPAAEEEEEEGVATSSEQQQQQPATEALRLSSDDIRASPRLLGYLFAVVAGSVQLVSVIQFYREEIIRPSGDEKTITRDVYYLTSGGSLVFRWKLWGAIYQSSVAAGLSLFTVLAHLDTILFPHQWILVFRDGSRWEQFWLLFLMLVWMAGLHITTSVLSVGEYQSNVYFSAWIGFCTMALTYGLWRESAGLPSLTERLTSEGTDYRQTTYNWIWTGIFSCIFAASATDIYYNRDDVQLRYRGERLDLDHSDWVLVLSISWTEVGLCVMAVALNEGLPLLRRFSCLFRSTGVAFYGWRQLEGLIIVTAIGAKFWAILEFTGYGETINGLSNAYFGIWGSFFNSVFAFGTWLRENKELESFNLNREEVQHTAEENDEQRSTTSSRHDGIPPEEEEDDMND